MIILEDSRQKFSKHDLKHAWFSQHKITVERTKLYVGDYTLPANQRICIDTKQDLTELVGNLTTSHDRFAREADRAREAGIELVFLIENDESIRSLKDVLRWSNPRYKIWQKKAVKNSRPPVSNEILVKIMTTFAEHHGCRWEFCSPNDAAKRIVEILVGENFNENVYEEENGRPMSGVRETGQ